MNSLALASGLVLAMSSSTMAAGLPFHPKLPLPTIFQRDGTGEGRSWAKARVERRDARTWCENWRPNDPVAECADEIMKSEAGKTYEASADCQTGVLVSVNGAAYRYDGIWEDDELFRGYSRWKSVETGEIVGTSNAAGGVTLSVQWSELCPYGAPLDRQPLKLALGEDDYSGMQMIYEHNGSSVYVDTRKGTISYSEPKQSLAHLVQSHSVLFRGTLIHQGFVHGMAFAFKKGCEPAPYVVEGYFDGTADEFILRGDAPVREGCEITSYSGNSANSTLRFRNVLY